jgi:hypothetical protein
MLGGRRRWFAVLAAVLALGILPGTARAQGEAGTLSILVLGDSYSSGNGAGGYSGTPSCRRSSANYARRFERLVEDAPGGIPTTVNTVACSGAVTADITRPSRGRAAQAAAATPDPNRTISAGKAAGASSALVTTAATTKATNSTGAGITSSTTATKATVATITISTKIRCAAAAAANATIAAAIGAADTAGAAIDAAACAA